MARKKKPEDSRIDDKQEIVDAVIVPEDETEKTTPDEATDTVAADQPDKMTDAPETVAADAGLDTLTATEGSDTIIAAEDAPELSDIQEPQTEITEQQAEPVTLDEPSGHDSSAVREADDTLAGDDATEAPSDHDTPPDDLRDIRPADELPADDPNAIADDPNSGKDTPWTKDTAKETVPDPQPAPAPPPQQVIVRKGGFFPLLLGGIVAAAIGFGAARYVLPEGWPWPGATDDTLAQDVAAQGTRIDDLAGTVDGIDLTPIEDRVAGLGDAMDTITTRLDEIATRLDETTDRLDTLEQRPIVQADGEDGGATSALAAELRDLQSSVEAQRAELDALIAEAQAQEEQAQADAQQAETAAQQALARAALARIQTALDTGSDFSGAVTDLRDTGVDVPAALADATGGVPTLAELQAEFPEAARPALSAARRSSGEADGLGGFLRTQLGVRSLEPQEGESPDAILSRAEAALRDGRLADTLAELNTLPPEGQTVMSDWIARAETRQNAVAAANELTQSLSAD